jgi:hypothetical protein
MTRQRLLSTLVAGVDIGGNSTNDKWAGAKCPLTLEPSKPIWLPAGLRARPAIQVDPESSTVDDLYISVALANPRVIKNDVRPRIPTDHCERLMQQP